MKKTNLIKVLAILLVALLVLPVVAFAFETNDYTIEIPEDLLEYATGDDEKSTFSDETDRNGILIVKEDNNSDCDEETFYTDEDMYEGMCGLMDSIISSIEEEVEENENGEYDGIALNGGIINNDPNERVKQFSKNNYKCNYLEGGFALTDVATQDDTLYQIEMYTTLHEDKVYTIIAMYEVGGDYEDAIKDAINTFTFKTTTEEVEEEPVEEEDNTKKDGKIAQAGVKVSFEGVAITMLAVCGLLLVVNNKRK